MKITDEIVEKAFTDFAAPFDHESNEWLDMDVTEIFRQGFLAGARAENEACAKAAEDAASGPGILVVEIVAAIRARHATPTDSTPQEK